jgi:hypothetical protein
MRKRAGSSVPARGAQGGAAAAGKEEKTVTRQGKEPPPLFPEIDLPDPPSLEAADNYLLRKYSNLRQFFVNSPYYIVAESKKKGNNASLHRKRFSCKLTRLKDVERYSDKYHQKENKLLQFIDINSMPSDLHPDKKSNLFLVDRKRPIEEEEEGGKKKKTKKKETKKRDSKKDKEESKINLVDEMDVFQKLEKQEASSSTTKVLYCISFFLLTREFRWKRGMK